MTLLWPCCDPIVTLLWPCCDPIVRLMWNVAWEQQPTLSTSPKQDWLKLDWWGSSSLYKPCLCFLLRDGFASPPLLSPSPEQHEPCGLRSQTKPHWSKLNVSWLRSFLFDPPPSPPKNQCWRLVPGFGFCFGFPVSTDTTLNFGGRVRKPEPNYETLSFDQSWRFGCCVYTFDKYDISGPKRSPDIFFCAFDIKFPANMRIH